MSPQQTKIKELDGLPAGEIHLAIAQSEQRTVRTMENKLDEHRATLECRLDTQDSKLATLQEDVTALVGTEKVPGMISRNTELLESLVTRHEEWHSEDLDYREQIMKRVEGIEAATDKLTTQVKVIRWFVATSNVLVKILTKCIEGLKTEAFWKVAGVGVVLYICAQFCPPLFQFLKQILLP